MTLLFNMHSMAMPKTWIRPMDSWTMDRSKNGSWIGKNPENKVNTL